MGSRVRISVWDQNQGSGIGIRIRVWVRTPSYLVRRGWAGLGGHGRGPGAVPELQRLQVIAEFPEVQRLRDTAWGHNRALGSTGIHWDQPDMGLGLAGHGTGIGRDRAQREQEKEEDEGRGRKKMERKEQEQDEEGEAGAEE